MTLYLAVHTPIDPEEETMQSPTDLQGLATQHGADGSLPRWLRAWSPDLNDDRIFTLWDADDAESICEVLKKFGFLNNMETAAFQVTEWGPDAVISSQAVGQQ